MPISQNTIILQAKQRYIEAEKRGDQAGMNAAHQMAEQARRNGGTIGADKSLEATQRVIQQEQYRAGSSVHSVPVPMPTYSPAKVSYNYNNKPTGTISSPVAISTNKSQVSAPTQVQAVQPQPVRTQVTTTSTTSMPNSTKPSTIVNSNDPSVQKSLAEIGRAQTAYQEYMKAGRTDLAQNASQYANEQREKLKTMGVSDSLYNPNVDLRSKYQGNQAGVYDTKQAGEALPSNTTKTLTVSDFAKLHPNYVASTLSNDFQEARQNPDGSVMITKGEDKGTLVLPPTHPNVSVQNAIAEDAKVKFLLGKVKHEDTTAYEASAQQARERGATLGANDDTVLTSAIKNYLQNDPLIAKAIETRNVNDLNKAMWKARNDYTYANYTNDSTGSEAAKQIERLMKDLGGNLSGNISLQQAHDVAFSTKTPDAGVAKEDQIGNTIIDILSGGPGVLWKGATDILKGMTGGVAKKVAETAVEKASGNSAGKVAEGTSNAGIQRVTSNLGNEIDITPSATHSTTTINPSYKGEPNTSVDILDPKTGEIKTRRWYGSDGKATRDVDFSQHGNPKQHPEAPHEHTWTYNEDGTVKSR